ncbi:Dolichyl-phosphate-mannose-protein mannosyltransferase, putative [Trichomonas vaginalis G3]|uniref:Dolichyl-phosphate-mannose-protein mannosyltransferase, putative n=1 Tax=Trichomonas vaginalis (strain ATCC PRA-98 / G3) TaxID=412133 RepID=A2F7N6_TRIV3|nr:dolichyl-phosphate-mannose-protein mannosyltransferase protein [Trichomonas vaginalis G3]EAX99063.1 Dolichyl-phosphate-mannose-protein mannosyltransferase, putative [Trichomonas vaginalis G3]KAI5534992.1 dolichyl-phosphate-mannose-protein mannosyltransferase protein [Trichomonas vaginalis G3]|eukprot:XP_001311993.1 Dolichyl-phosphate-mannose-protein mannosyltransferase [Trichomonas vaginalis G3]
MQKFIRFVNWLQLYRLRKYFVLKHHDIVFEFKDLINILILSGIAYYARSKAFEYPAGMVFDEVHFGNFTNHYIKHEFFFDIHPPLAKLIFAKFAWLAEYDGSIEYSDEGERAYSDEKYITTRVAPIMLSSLVPAAMYIALRCMALSKIASFTSSFMAALDTTLIAEGKFCLTDGTLHLFTMVGMIGINIWLSKEVQSKSWWLWIYIASICMSFAYSVKNTALSLFFVAGYAQLMYYLDEKDFEIDENSFSEICRSLFTIVYPGLIFHYIIWYFHITTTPFIYEDTKDDEIQSYTLNYKNTTDLTKWVYWPPVVARVANCIGSAFMSNGLNFEPHPYMSRPKDWPLLTDVWVSFYHDYGLRTNCVCAGNVFVYYTAFFGVLACMLGFTRKGFAHITRLIVGYWMSYLPFFGVPRTMFLYHYLIPLMFGCMCFGAALDLWIKSGYWKGFIALSVMVAALTGFFIISPLVYGYKTPEDDWRILNKKWEYGREDRKEYHDYMQSMYLELKTAEEKEEAQKSNKGRRK